jgi:hypothetical protein
MDFVEQLKNYLDEQGRLLEWPSRRNKRQFQQWALEYLASKFEREIYYSEREVNAVLNQHHTFNDPALLRRELVERQLLDRVKDGSAYWRRDDR